MRADELHRTARAFVEDERFPTLEAAIRFLETFVLQVDVPAELNSSRQAMLLTIVNTASRAFLGGVHVRLAEDVPLTGGWGASMGLSEAIQGFGGKTVHVLDDHRPTIALGTAIPELDTVVWPTWDGWGGGVVIDPNDRLKEEAEFELAAAMAGAFAVSECFQRFAGEARACRRSFGVSLWRPDLDWRDSDATGPACTYMPNAFWLPGLGHLGQAYSWMIGLLPYADRSGARLTLQDFDYLVKANRSTGLLASLSDVGRRKTRVVAEQLEQLGFTTTIVERAFDENTIRQGDEPLLCLAGFDSPVPRRALGRSGFDRIVDAGLGRGPRGYLEMLVQSFPSGIDTADKFPDPSTPPTPEELRSIPAFNEMVIRLINDGTAEGDAECGMVDIAGTTAAASFVGAVAAALVLAEPLRLLHGGESYEAISFSLRSPERLEAARATQQPAPVFGVVGSR
jgi:hypothetical protein